MALTDWVTNAHTIDFHVDTVNEMDTDQGNQIKSSKLSINNNNTLHAILHPGTNAEIALKLHFENAFQKHLARWIYQQSKLCHMLRHVSQAGITSYWFNDALRNMCPKCFRQQFLAIWLKEASNSEKKQMATIVTHILTKEFDIMELADDKEFRTRIEDRGCYIQYPDSRISACIC